MEAALDAAYGSNGFTVAGAAQGPYTVEFIGTLGGRDIAGLFTADLSRLTRSAQSNDDYFKWTAADTGILDVQVLFEHASGNVDMQVLNASGTVVASSASIDDNERITMEVTAGQKYVVRVYGAAGALQSDYSLRLDGPGVSPDQFEPNNSFSAAAALDAGDRTYQGLTIHAPFNDDWFKFTPTMSGELDVRITFQSALGDLDMDLYDASQNLLDSGSTSGNSEQVSYDTVAGQTYYVHVKAPLGGYVQPSYNLTIDGPAPNLDALEPNDSSATARDLGTGDQTHEDLSIHAANNDDWYKWTVTGGGTVTVGATFLHAQGNLDLEVYDADLNLLQASASTDNDESVATDLAAGQSIYVRGLGPMANWWRTTRCGFPATMAPPCPIFRTRTSPRIRLP